MARWVARCEGCGYEHTHSLIPTDGPLSNFYFEPKPDIPGGMGEFKCPKCGEKRTYTRFDLNYRA
jgi:hypothetical protein